MGVKLQRNCATSRPLISLDRIKRSYFIHESIVHNVDSAPSSIFKAAIRAHLDLTNIQQEATDVLDGPDDLFSRWWLLCYCAKSMPLFAFRADAEHAMGTVETTARTR